MTNEEIKLITEAVSQSMTETMSQLIDEKLKPINDRLDNIENRLDKVDERLDNMDERLEIIEENTEITRTATNEIVEWIDMHFREDYPFPVGTSPKKSIKLN